MQPLQKLGWKLKRNEDPEMAYHLSKQANNLYQQWEILSQTSSPNVSPVPIGKHQLSPLPYSYEALEPYIDRRIMRLHHDKHHQSYVDGLNKAEKEMDNARKTNQFDLIKHWEIEAAFHGTGHYLHTIFWTVMSPNGGGEPKGELAAEITRSFGSFKMFKQHFLKPQKM
ncbi:superoxide dismutase [Jeotgalibacillus soli]|uniref:superoxide dismutase n=1 Tax=Jeotgalibacillus soli TaxID=889306 RepID=A0A0C2W735_9BACL|nr:superoxide dismutase [Jeotgalibacillus soli]